MLKKKITQTFFTNIYLWISATFNYEKYKKNFFIRNTFVNPIFLYVDLFNI